MPTSIGAETAKLAGLQIDQLSKLRDGQLSLEQIAWWNNLSYDNRDRLMRGECLIKPTPPVIPVTEKFVLLADLGEITVPADYDHDTYLDKFREKNKKKFYGYNENLTSANFVKATVRLTPGRKFKVRAFKQAVSGTTTSEERMEYLRLQKAVLTGAHGAALVWQEKRSKLPKGFWYSSFDEKEGLWEDADGDHRVPNVRARLGGDFGFSLGCFEGVWYVAFAFLCFCDFE